MTPWTQVLGAFLLLGPLTPAAQSRPFEGAITMRVNPAATGGVSGAGAAQVPSQTFEYLVRGGRLRMSLLGGPASGMAVIASPQEQKLYMLVPGQRSYMELPMAVPAATANGMTANATTGAASEAKVERTGRKETVAGYACEHVIVTAPRTPAIDVCLTTELGRYLDPMQGMRASAPPAWQQALADGFPLKVTLANGTVAMEVTAVERRRLDNALFTVPSSYTKIAAPVR